MVVYNLSVLYNVSSLPDLVNRANTASNDLLVSLFIVAVWVIMFVAFLRFDVLRAFASSSFSTFLLSGFLYYLDLIDIRLMLLFLFFTGLSGLLMYLEERGG